MTAVAPKKRGRTSFTEAAFAETTSLTALPSYDQPSPTSAPLDELAHNPHNPREGYEGETLYELAASLRETGQLQPATVVGRDVYLAHHPDSADVIGAARWVVLTGNRRLAAARLAELDRLTITVSDRLAGADPRLSEATLIENLHREALPPLLEARELAALVERHGSQSAVAKRVSKTQAWVSQRLSLLKLAPQLQDQLRAGAMTVREARTVAGAPLEEQQQALDELRRPPEPAAPEPPTATPSRRPRPRTATPADPSPEDVRAIARDLRARLSAEQLAELAALLATSGS